jgi:hypothetical protein
VVVNTNRIRKVVHEIAREEPIGFIDGTWYYKIFCSCGSGVIEAGPFPSGYLAGKQAYQMWRAHAEGHSYLAPSRR